MKATTLSTFLGLAIGLGTIACQSGPAASAPATGSGAVVARVADREITLTQVDREIEGELRRLESERYRARRARIDLLVNEALVEAKARSLGISPEELNRREVVDKVPEPTEEVVRSYYERFKSQGSYEEISPRIRQALVEQARQAREAEYLAGLRKESKVEISLAAPRIEVETAGGQSQGPGSAPITLVEFSDYQCPFCARSQATVGQVLQKYEGKIHHVFMDFPLTGIHPQAMPAAVAGRCAGEQGKFWEYHKLLFEKQADLSAESFRKWAGDLSLDAAKFDSCLSSDRHEAAIRKSLDVGQSAGVSGTPGFFVNGIFINGAQPFEVFEEAIEDELARAKS